MPDDEMDLEELRSALTDALHLQARSALHYTVVAGSLRGLTYLAVADRLGDFALAEIRDTRRLVEKAVSFGCVPEVTAQQVDAGADPEKQLRTLVDSEREVLAALHGVIPHTGQRPESEAVEHLLEHLIERKQAQVDLLLRLLG